MILRKYKVYCVTEAKLVDTDYIDEEKGAPTKCPVDTAHTIDASKGYVAETIRENVVSIEEENIPNVNPYQTRSSKIVLPASAGWQHVEFSFPFDIYLYAADFHTTEGMDGDEIQLIAGEDTPIGAISSDITTPLTIIPVDSSVMAFVENGHLCKISDGTNTDNLNRVISVDRVNNTITVETATANNFTASTPTYVKVTKEFVPVSEITGNAKEDLGGAKIGGSKVPASTIIKALYNNISETAKTFRFWIQYTIKQD